MGTTERHLIRGRDSHQDIVAAVVTIIGCAAKVRESREVKVPLRPMHPIAERLPDHAAEARAVLPWQAAEGVGERE
jgi:hypothetical protein